MKLATTAAVMLLSLFTAASFRAEAQVASESELRKNVEYFSSATLAGRAAGSMGERAAADYLYKQLQAAGVYMLTGPELDDFTISDSLKGPIHSMNVVGIVEGTDPSLKNECIVVGAHLDGVGTISINNNGVCDTLVYPGAGNDGAGLAALIEIARYVASGECDVRRSVYFVGFGASEFGFAGSWYFVNRSFADYLGNAKLMVDLDMLGRGSEDYPFRVFSPMSRSDLNALMDSTRRRMVAKPPIVTNEEIIPSDHLPFHNAGIPTVLFTTGRNPEGNTVDDVPELVMYPELRKMCSYVDLFVENASCASKLTNALLVKESESAMAAATAKADDVYSFGECDERPTFFKNDESFFLKKWVYTYLKYPQEAIKNGIMGTVLVSFIIEKDGSVTNVNVVKSAGEMLDDAAVKVINASPKWAPGKINGKKVRTSISLPVEFRLRKN
jgi:TonB family protein